MLSLPKITGETSSQKVIRLMCSEIKFDYVLSEPCSLLLKKKKKYCTWSGSEHISGAFGHKQYCSDESTTSS